MGLSRNCLVLFRRKKFEIRYGVVMACNRLEKVGMVWKCLIMG